MQKLSIGVALVLAGCIVEAPTLEGTLSAAQVPTGQPVQVRVPANFGDKIQMLGATLSSNRIVPGEIMKVVMDFRVLAKLDKSYIIFVHADDIDGRIERQMADHRPTAKDTKDWQPGENIRDEFQFVVPRGATARGIAIFTGFWDPDADARLPIVNSDQVRTDGKGRLLVATLPLVTQ